MLPIGGVSLSALDANAVFLGDKTINNQDVSSQSKEQLEEHRQQRRQQHPEILLYPAPQSSNWWSAATSWLFPSARPDPTMSSCWTYNTTTSNFAPAPTTLREHAISILNPTQHQQQQVEQQEEKQRPADPGLLLSSPGLLGAKEKQPTRSSTGACKHGCGEGPGWTRYCW
ncbi:hypothetical protein VTJ83DRAFT_6101 [Remersonia thermophila]|uniref:Uncharacterized protein n=1 Tax=Remersonia thermophila TaxID=72144 RepID=A0ABR4D9N8_9PEZI